jgi:Domain of unknown function, B. Theta Gene description (DUF3871)
MEQALIQTENNLRFIEDVPFEEVVSTSKPFIEANTVEASMDELVHKHIIPVFIKDNEPVISHVDFIESASQMVSDIYHGEHILKPNIRLSHPIKGRIPDAKNKPANQLLEHEKTLYYERMAFIIEIPSITGNVDGNELSLTIGGVKSYNLDNLYNRKGADEHFKVFAGFQNKVCTNMCIWSDGFMSELKVRHLGQLKACIRTQLENYNSSFHIEQMQQLTNYSLTEQQFATMVGRCRMYHHLPNGMKSHIPSLLLGDTQLGMICKDYYRDNSFCRDNDGNINLWRLYNLFTGANKSSYIDNFLDRSVNSYHFVDQIKWALQEKSSNWFLN